ncbi:MAG: Rieske 2Fe-2S domain-containing protein [Actinomycetota bacterium]
MLTKEANERLTRVGPGTPMGELMRRYWYPVAFVRELDEWPIKKVRLLGENFALWKTRDGGYGILQESCPHRAASLVYGVIEEEGLRCGYHGWLYGTDGQCLQQPAEPATSTFKHKIRAQAGVARSLGGMVWAYVGPSPAPELPRFDVFVMDGVRDIGHSVLPCNWLQIMENSVDPHHVEWLHGRYFNFLAQTSGFEMPSAFTKAHVKVGFDAFEWGIIKRRLLEGQSEEDDDWKVGHPMMFPYCMRVGGNGIDQMQIRVPVDDTHTWAMFYSTHNPPGLDSYPEQVYPFDYEYQWRDENGRHIVDYVEGQDVMAWVSQGEITDRTAEHIGKSDIGVTMLRRMFRQNMAAVEQGRDPMGVIREPRDRIDLPCERSKFGAGAEFALQWIDRGSSRYSPHADMLKKLHIAAAQARGEPVPAGSPS